MSKLLALDLAVEATGWALFDGQGPPLFGTVRLNKHRDFAYAMAEFQQFLEEKFHFYCWDAMAWEKPILMPTDTPDKIAGAYGLAGVSAAFAGRRKMRWETVTVYEVKEAVCGALWKDNGLDGKRKMVDKADMIRCAREIWDWNVQTHHEADAGGVGLIAYEAIWP